MNLKNRLRDLLKERGWSIAELSRRSGNVPSSTISEWLNGNKGVRNLDHLKSVADAFAVSIDELCFGEEPKDNPSNLHSILNGLTNIDSNGFLSGNFQIKIRPIRNLKE
ncbi:MAG: hypothetical protein RJB66_49 [Pseudomonadota bacterium]|jgi:transcriptional regulator with XRE-family HTH domain